MKMREIYPNLFLYTFPNQYELASTFIRLQEFYESPYKDIKGKYFTLEQFMNLYAKDQKDNKFTYFEDWNGFNIPGNIISKFAEKFVNNLTKKENKLIDKIPYSKDDFYIIGVVNNGENTLEHEIAHGLYYLNKDYNKQMSKLIKEMPKPLRSMAENHLRKLGYCKAVLKDELQAYFATGLDKGMISICHHIIYQSYIQKIRKVFRIYYNEVKVDKRNIFQRFSDESVNAFSKL